MEKQNKKTPLILTIDDDDSIRVTYRMFLEKKGYHVIEAENGRIGLEKFASEKPDLLLVDLDMPEVGGLEVLDKVIAAKQDVPVIIVSGVGVIDDVAQALRLGAWDYLFKPIDLSVLQHVVEKNIERSRLIKQNKQFRHSLEEKIKRIREDEEAGRKIQSQLLPKEHKKCGPYDMRHKIIPSMLLSGDFVDYTTVDENHVLFYTADVSGHGISSALITVLLKSFMRKLIDEFRFRNDKTILHPDKLLEKLNQELIEEKLEKHIAIFYGILNCKTNILTYANGGQYPNPILHGDKTEVLHGKGSVVGLFPFAQFEAIERALPKKFLMTIFSDGVLDIIPKAHLDDKLRYIEALKTDRDIENLIQMSEQQGDLPDDITVFSIQREIN